MTTRTLQPTGAFVTRVLKNFMAASGVEPTLLGANKLRILNARPGQVNLELDIHKQHTNRLNIVHGATIASLVDLGGSLVVASMGLFATGVSTDLNVTYIGSAGKAGDKLKATATMDSMGKTLAYTRVAFYNTSGDLVARGSHTKYIKRALAEQNIPYREPFTEAPEGDEKAEN